MADLERERIVSFLEYVAGLGVSFMYMGEHAGGYFVITPEDCWELAQDPVAFEARMALVTPEHFREYLAAKAQFDGRCAALTAAGRRCRVAVNFPDPLDYRPGQTICCPRHQSLDLG